ncbi:hypothetical protein ILYODFUR_027119 [Ilyodon furcidens]|uniref:FAM69 N-terminal domain-containing protein n=1 Tax=Ilyodon furcidens TaxID=33524 RepID=A0ABV0TMD7_9TELE
MCEDLCVHSLVEYKRCLYYENGKKVIEARWRGSPIILKSKLENFSSYEPLGILDYQVTSVMHKIFITFCQAGTTSLCVFYYQTTLFLKHFKKNKPADQSAAQN